MCNSDIHHSVFSVFSSTFVVRAFITARLYEISLQRWFFSNPSLIKVYFVLSTNSISSASTPYSFIRVISFCLTVEELKINRQIILSIISTTPKPYFSLETYYSAETSLSAYFPIFCIYSVRIQKIFQSFQNLFSESLAYTLILQISEELRTIVDIKLRQFQSIIICQSISFPLIPCLIKIAKMYFNPPNSIRFSTMACQSLVSVLVNELAKAFSPDTENQFLAFTNCSIISFPFIQWQTNLDFANFSEGLISKMFTQVNRLPRYYCQSLLEGVLLRYGRIDSIRISIPQRLWKFSWAFYEFESRKASRSLPTNLLSSITLCFTTQFGMILLERQSRIFVSFIKVQIDSYTCSVSVQMILSILSAISYSSTLSSSFILRIVSTKFQQSPFQVSQTHILQYISKIQSFQGSSDMIQCKNQMQEMLISELGWLSILRMETRSFDCTRMGMCYWLISCRL